MQKDDKYREFLVLYGSPNQGIKNWYHFIQWCYQLAEEFGHKLTHIGISGVGGFSGKLVEFERTMSKIKKVNSKDIPNSIELYSLSEDFKQVVFDWDFAVSINDSKGILFIGIATRENLDFLNYNTMLKIVHASANYFQIIYGYSGLMHKKYGPLNRVFGFASGNEEMDEINKIGKWRRELKHQKRHLQNLFFDIHKFNIISENHLANDIDAGKSLENWIKENAEYGDIKCLKDKIYIWQININNLNQLREILSVKKLFV